MTSVGQERHVTQSEAATLCGCDYTTIRRHRERGNLPGARRRDDPNGTWEIPVGDLITAGLWRPGEGEDVAAAMGRSNAERRFEETRLELERVRAKNDALLDLLDERRDEIAYLRKALELALRNVAHRAPQRSAAPDQSADRGGSPV